MQPSIPFDSLKGNSMGTLTEAIDIAVAAHRGQKRRGGTPYILHPMRVMFRQKCEEAMIVAVLHDVVEDTEVTICDLEQAGFSSQILKAIELLTHEDEVPYSDYVKLIALNELARSVKVADLEDNMNVRELPELEEKDLERMVKYHKAWIDLNR